MGSMFKSVATSRKAGPGPGIIIIHLLGLAPAGYLTAPDNGPKACCGDVQVKASVDALCH
jgi:hypothetical protein